MTDFEWIVRKAVIFFTGLVEHGGCRGFQAVFCVKEVGCDLACLNRLMLTIFISTPVFICICYPEDHELLRVSLGRLRGTISCSEIGNCRRTLPSFSTLMHAMRTDSSTQHSLDAQA